MKNNDNNYIGQYFTAYDDIKFKFQMLSSANVGILNGFFTHWTIETNLPKNQLLSCFMPNFSRDIYKDIRKIQYHICGYDDYITEALTRMCGEAVERYAAFIAVTVVPKEKFLKTSYEQLIKDNKNVLDLKYINVIKTEDMAEFSRFNNEFSSEKLSESTEINWVPIYSAFEDSFKYVPAQLFFSGFPSLLYNEKRYILSMSTGTASHVNTLKAFKNALIEPIQLHTFNLNWYFNIKAKKININDDEIQKYLDEILINTNLHLDFCLYQNKENDIPIIGCFVYDKNQNFPAIAFGIQGDFSVKDALKRAALEALAVYNASYCTFIAEKFKNRDNSEQEKPETCEFEDKYYDLDKNILFYADSKNYEINFKKISEKIEGEINFSDINDSKCLNLSLSSAIEYILKELRKKGRTLLVRDITPLEVKDYYAVIRVLIPEFLPVCLPSLPYADHPEIQGMRLDDYIHPLA